MEQGSILPFLQKSKSSRPVTSRPGRPYGSRPSSSKTTSTGQHRGPNRRRNMDLKKVADETKAELPNVLSQLPTFDANNSSIHNLKDLAALDAHKCPGFVLPDSDGEAGKKGCRIQVHDMDTYDAAIILAPDYKACTYLGLQKNSISRQDGKQQDLDLAMEDSTEEHKPPSNANISINKSTDDDTFSTPARIPKPVAVLNLASERSAGGGWQNGALAQEEALCYRSSLYLSLHKSYYPLSSLSAIYSPSVLIIRDAMSRGHNLLIPAEQPADLPVTSVISVAALRRPALTADGKGYKNEGQRAETKRKIRLTLRIAALGGHTKLVLGALGCGVFANPPNQVANCFIEVLREKEFQGGWWESVVFAILDNVKGEHGGKDGVGNFGEFYRVLAGEVV
jgi:uncharacterized protein (TIGR02452 family)